MATVAKKDIDRTFGQRLRALREARGWTQAQLGEKAGGMMYQVVARLERGEREPVWATVLRLAAALEVTPDAFTVEGGGDPG